VSFVCLIYIYIVDCDVAEVLNRKSVYLRASLGFENAEGPKHTVELYVEWRR